MPRIQSSKVDTTDFDELFARGHARSAQLENSAFDQSGQSPLSFDMEAARRFQQAGAGSGNEAEKLGTPFEIFSKEAAFKQSRKGAGIGYEEKVQSFLHDQQGREYHGGDPAATQQQSAPPPGRPGRMQDQLGGDRGRQQRQQQEQLPFGGQVPAAQGTAAKPRYIISNIKSIKLFCHHLENPSPGSRSGLETPACIRGVAVRRGP